MNWTLQADHWVRLQPKPWDTPKFRNSPWKSDPSTKEVHVPAFAAEVYDIKVEGDLRQLPPNPLRLLQCPFQGLWPFQAQDLLEGFLRGPWGEWAQVGLGKTLMTLSAFWCLLHEGQVDGMIVLGPESARHSWVGPSADTSRLGFRQHLIEASTMHAVPWEGVIYCNYDKIWRPKYSVALTERLRSRRWVLCCDEAHYLTGLHTNRFREAYRFAQMAPYRWLLTGTPVSNWPDKLQAIWRLLTLNDCSENQWLKWFRPNGVTWNQSRLKVLGKYLSRISRTRTRKEVSPQLPQTTITTIPVPLSGTQRTVYHDLIHKDKATVGGLEVVTVDYLSKMTRLMGTASHHQLLVENTTIIDPISKLAILQELLEGIEGKVVLWSWHPRVLDWLGRTLREWGPVTYHGEVSASGRAYAIEAFTNDPTRRLFLGNPSAAGAGLNLPSADVRIYFDAFWSPVQYEQSAGRIERGITYNPKTEYRLVGENTIEEYIWEMVAKKQDLRQLILHGKDPNKAKAAEEIYKQNVVQRWR